MSHMDRILKARRIIICACGTSWHSALIAEYLLEDFTRVPVEVEYASEFRYRRPIILEDDVVIAVSQSGETADTLAAVREAKRNGALALGVVNSVGSTIARETDAGIYLHVGPEIGVASTKVGFLFLSPLFIHIYPSDWSLSTLLTNSCTKAFAGQVMVFMMMA